MSPRSRSSVRPARALLIATAIACAAAILASPASAAGKSSKTRVLVVKQAHNPVFGALKRRLAKLGIDHSPPKNGKRGHHDLLVLDGDALSAHRMARSKTLHRFTKSGRWVLALDVGSKHHRRALADETGFEALAQGEHTSRAFLFRHAVINGVPSTPMLDVPNLNPSGTGKVSRKQRRKSKRAEARRIADMVGDRIEASDDELAQITGASAPAPQDVKIPDSALVTGYPYTVTGTHHPKDGYVGCGNHGYQEAQWTMNHTFTVYLDNSVAHPQGDYQIVTYDLQGTFNPVRQGTAFWEMFQSCAPALTKYTLNRAWWTVLLSSSVAPTDAATDQKLTWQANAPNTPNQETTTSSEEGFDVGISAEGKEGGVNLTYHADHGKSVSIPDWGVVSNTSGNNASWEFSSRNRCDPRAGHAPEDNCFHWPPNTIDTYPNEPNALSLGQMEIDTSARWRTKQLLDHGSGDLSFTVGNPVTLIDIGCTNYELGFCIRHDIDRDQTGPAPQTYKFDASDVIPIPIKSVDLKPSTANGAKNEKVTGTVTLERPTPFKTKVVVLSNKENAVVGPPVTDQVTQGVATIDKGATQGTFPVQTNDNKLKPGQHVTAYITAFYAEAFDPVPLRVESPKSG